MPEVDNAQTLLDIYDAYGRGDATLLFDAIHEEKFVMTEHSDSPTTPWGGVRHGKKGMIEFIETVGKHMTHQAYVCEGILAGEDETQPIACWGYFETECARSGRPSKHKWMHLITFEDGKITSIDEFYDSLALKEDLSGCK